MKHVRVRNLTEAVGAEAFLNELFNLANINFNATIDTTLGFGRTDETSGAETKLSQFRPVRPNLSIQSPLLPDVPGFSFSH